MATINVNGMDMIISEANYSNYTAKSKLGDPAAFKKNQLDTLYSMALTAKDAMLPASMHIDTLAVSCSGSVIVLSSMQKLPYIKIVSDGFGLRVKERNDHTIMDAADEDFLANNAHYLATVKI